jgi:alpha-ribazole phosphatase
MSQTKQVLLIRHATTDLAGTLCGQINPPLNDAGCVQAETLADSLRTRPVDLVYTSDLLRAVQTAERLVRDRRIPVLQRADLREIAFGTLEGMRWAEVQAHLGFAIEAIESSPDMCPPGGELFTNFQKRVIRGLDEIALDSSQGTTAVVTHLGVIRIAFTSFAKIDPSCELLRTIDYCSAHQFNISDGAWEFGGRL